MIYLYIKRADFSALPPRERNERESYLARDILFSALSEELSLPTAQILKDERGKPYFESAKYPAFSVSHSADAVAVCFSTENTSVGVDIESCGRV